MSSVKQNKWVMWTIGILSLGIGYAIGTSLAQLDDTSHKIENKAQASETIDPSKNLDELTEDLSNVMLPKAEYHKLSDAIYQTGMGLLTTQAQSSGIQVDQDTIRELKKSIAKKYSREFFTKMNADSMKELDKSEIIAILKFYKTDAGKKFLTLSPKIISNTMSSVRADMASWLPNKVEKLVSKMKEKSKQENKNNTEEAQS